MHSASPLSQRVSLTGTGLVPRTLTALTATFLVAAAAHLAFPLPFTPVPFTLQPLAVLLVGLLLGPVDGGLAMLAYLAEGCAGLPVFSPTGPGGVMQLLGPTGGYLLAYPVVAFVAGLGVRRASSRIPAYPAALSAGCVAVALLFIAGAGWLAHVTGLRGHALWIAAVLPFLPGEIAKVFIAAGVYRASVPVFRP